MLFRTGLRQTLRAPVRLIASFLVIALVSAFLCIGLNLYLGAEENAKKYTMDFTSSPRRRFLQSAQKPAISSLTKTRMRYSTPRTPRTGMRAICPFMQTTMTCRP